MTLVGTTGGEQAPIPVAIDGTPLKSDPLLAEAQRMRDGKTEAVKIAPPVPVYTVPQNATLFSNDTLTALVGIVPNLQGSVVDPIRFKLITGNTNLATNSLYLPPGVKNIVWSGIAIGNREMSCVRGELHSVTFTFEDGTIRTVNSQADSGKSKLGGNLLGYISTQKGNPCLPGQADHQRPGLSDGSDVGLRRGGGGGRFFRYPDHHATRHRRHPHPVFLGQQRRLRRQPDPGRLLDRADRLPARTPGPGHRPGVR